MEIIIKTHGIAEAAKAVNGIEGELLHAADQGVRLCLQRHFMARQSEPRRDGFPKQGFWFGNKGISVWERVRPTEFGTHHAVIRIASAALAHKVAANPPPIVPKRGKFLTIPATASTVGMSARDCAGIMFGYALTPSGDRRKAIMDKSGRALYWLVKRAVTPHDPRALPSRKTIGNHIEMAFASFVKTLSSNHQHPFSRNDLNHS